MLPQSFDRRRECWCLLSPTAFVVAFSVLVRVPSGSAATASVSPVVFWVRTSVGFGLRLRLLSGLSLRGTLGYVSGLTGGGFFVEVLECLDGVHGVFLP